MNRKARVDLQREVAKVGLVNASAFRITRSRELRTLRGHRCQHRQLVNSQPMNLVGADSVALARVVWNQTDRGLNILSTAQRRKIQLVKAASSSVARVT